MVVTESVIKGTILTIELRTSRAKCVRLVVQTITRSDNK